MHEKNTMIKMTESPLGVACIERNSNLIGIITDGDLRRSFTKFKSLDDITAGQVMTGNFEYISPKVRLGRCTEKRKKEILQYLFYRLSKMQTTC